MCFDRHFVISGAFDKTILERIERNDREDAWSGSPLRAVSDVTVAAPFQPNTVGVVSNNE